MKSQEHISREDTLMASIRDCAERIETVRNLFKAFVEYLEAEDAISEQKAIDDIKKFAA